MAAPAPEVRGQVVCSVKMCAAVTLAIILAIILVVIVVHMGAGSEPEPVSVGDFEPPDRSRRSTEEDLFEAYWSTYENKTVPNSTDTEDSRVETDGNWSLTSKDSLFMATMAGVSGLLILAVVALSCVVCAHHSTMARMRRRRVVSNTENWLDNHGFTYNQRPIRGRSIPTSKLDSTPAMMRAKRMKVRNELHLNEPGVRVPRLLEDGGAELPGGDGIAWGMEEASGLTLETETSFLLNEEQIPEVVGDHVEGVDPGLRLVAAAGGTDDLLGSGSGLAPSLKRATMAAGVGDPRVGPARSDRRPQGSVFLPSLDHDLDAEDEDAPGLRDASADHLQGMHGPASEYSTLCYTTDFTYQG